MLNRIRERGLRIKLFNTLTVCATVGMAVLVILSTVWLDTQYADLIEAEISYNQSVTSANMLQAGSDNLTRQVQYFTQTADVAFMDAYFREVSAARRERALHELTATPEEQAMLNFAKEESDALMVLEYRIMRLVAQSLAIAPESLPKAVRDSALDEDELTMTPEALRALARDIAFGDAYRLIKESIDSRVEDFTNIILERELRTINEYTARVDRHISLQQLLLTLLIIVVVSTGVFLYSQLILVLHQQVNHILRDEPLEIRGVYEMRYLSRVYNRLREKNRQTERELKKRANMDALTGILNRGAFERLVSRKIAGEGTGVFVMLDTNEFKSVNDRFGHDMGDKLLRRIAGLLSSSFRGGDLAGRLGGDEFGLWLAKLSDDNIEYIRLRLGEINEKLLQPDPGQPEAKLPPVSLSAGIAVCAEGDDYQSLYKRADEALYRAKSAQDSHCALSGRA